MNQQPIPITTRPCTNAQIGACTAVATVRLVGTPQVYCIPCAELEQRLTTALRPGAALSFELLNVSNAPPVASTPNSRLTLCQCLSIFVQSMRKLLAQFYWSSAATHKISLPSKG